MALTDNIVGCWSPSVRGSGLLLPELVNSAHATLTNFDQSTAWEPASVRGVSGRTNRHDGSNDFATGSPRTIIGLGDMTFTAWVLVRSGYGVLCHSNWSAGMLWYAGNVGAAVVNQGIYFANSATAAVGVASMTYNIWHHIGWCRRGTSLDIYLNGRLDVTRTSNTGPTFANTLDWGGYSGGSEWLPGSIGERAIWRRALTAPEIADIYRRGNGAIGRELTGQTRRRVYGFVPAGFKAYWVQQKSRVIGGGV